MNVYFWAKNGIYKPLPISDKQKQYDFKVKIKNSSVVVDVNINNNGSQINAVSCFDISSEFYNSLCDNKERGYLESSVIDEFKNILMKLHEVIENVFCIIKQELFLYELRWLTSEPMEWSTDRIKWKVIPLNEVNASIWGHQVNVRDDKWSNSLQTLFDAMESPLFATEHLHEAVRSRIDRFKWIQATIAAELAIKEVLSRLEPRLKVILFKLPSPPIDKLYRDVLMDIVGVSSPFTNKLKKGAEVRNKLIHSPESVKLNSQDVLNYTTMVKAAIDHLLVIERDLRKNSKITILKA